MGALQNGSIGEWENGGVGALESGSTEDWEDLRVGELYMGALEGGRTEDRKTREWEHQK